MHRPKIHPKQKKKRSELWPFGSLFPLFSPNFPNLNCGKKLNCPFALLPFERERERERQIDGDGGCADRIDSRARIPSNEKTCWCTSFSVEFKSKDADLSKRHDQAFDKNRRNFSSVVSSARARARQKREPKRWERHLNECNAQNVTTTYHRSERQGCPCTSSPSCSLIRKENVTTSIQLSRQTCPLWGLFRAFFLSPKKKLMVRVWLVFAWDLFFHW